MNGLSSNQSFGRVMAAFFCIVGLWPLWHSEAARWWAIAVAVGFLVVTFVKPSLLQPLNRVWMAFGDILHKVVSPVAMGVVFFVTILPTGLMLRLFGKDMLRLKKNAQSESYWITRESPTADSYKMPF